MKYILKKNAKILILVGISIIIVNILSASHPLVMKKILDIDIYRKQYYDGVLSNGYTYGDYKFSENINKQKIDYNIL